MRERRKEKDISLRIRKREFSEREARAGERENNVYFVFEVCTGQSQSKDVLCMIPQCWMLHINS